MISIEEVRVIPIEVSDSDITSVAGLVQEKINELIRSGERVASVQLVPCTTSYSVPIDGSYRDDHYTDRGFLAIVSIRSESVDERWERLEAWRGKRRPG